MQIYLVRHGAAQDTAPGGDRARALTSLGREQFRRVAERLAREAERPSEVWASPLVRAAQTAEILAAGLQLSMPVETVRDLAPGAVPDEVLRVLGRRDDDARVALVGHEPDLAHLASVLAGRALGAFEKGAIWRFDVRAPPAQGKAKLVWRLAPRTLEIEPYGTA